MRGMALTVSASSAFAAPRGTYPAYRSVSSSEAGEPDIQILSAATLCPGAGGLLLPFWQCEPAGWEWKMALNELPVEASI